MNNIAARWGVRKFFVDFSRVSGTMYQTCRLIADCFDAALFGGNLNMEKYDSKAVEQKWAAIWENNEQFQAKDFSEQEKCYILTEFFGPSGKGLHLGHIKCFTPSDIFARYKRFKGFNVLYPAGWDAFGLPTENYAIKTGIHPSIATENNVGVFKTQINKVGFSFDWSREISTCDPDYYKWSQWIFIQLFKNGLAYKEKGAVNFCPSCKTVLSNEDSQGGICDRCNNEVEQRSRDVWYLKMTAYAEKMLDGIDAVDYPENVKAMQRNWIGKSMGCEIVFDIDDTSLHLEVFTTRPDTLFGATFMVVAPEHPIITELGDRILNLSDVIKYRDSASKKTAIERSSFKDKTGICLEGVSAINPVSGNMIPVYIADYVMMGYGTGAIMAVPAHDDRDYEFAKLYGIPIIQVISGGNIEESAYAGDGELINSGFLNGLNVQAAKEKMIDHLSEAGKGTGKVNYKMQDWSFNRQRYWGEPIPLVKCGKCGFVPVPEDQLPLLLPEVDDFNPDDSGNSPLAKLSDWVSTSCPECGGPAERETDTMPNWAGSSWYWLRFIDPHNDSALASLEKQKYWGPVDLYTGGLEHVTRHMLYASFWNHFLYDIGVCAHPEPFSKRLCNGLILSSDGSKMGKSAGNAVDPIEMVDLYGADAFRLHVMFMGDYENNTLWTDYGIVGCVRFVNNVWELKNLANDDDGISDAHEIPLNQLIKFVEEGYESFSFNTVVAKLMTFVNIVNKSGYITKGELKAFLILLNPLAPFVTSELFNICFGGSITDEPFPVYDPERIDEPIIQLPVQINGKMKGTVSISRSASQDEALEAARERFNLAGEIAKIYFVPEKILNIVINK